MSELQKRERALQEITELWQAIEPAKNEEIARRALELAEYYLVKAENQAGHIQRLEERNKRMRGKWVKENIVLTSTPPKYQWHCSECGTIEYGYSAEFLTDFCPNCGAWMGGQE